MLSPRKIGDLTYGGEIYQFMRIGKGCLSYMVVSNGEAAVVDPQGSPKSIHPLRKKTDGRSNMSLIPIFTRTIYPADGSWQKQQEQLIGSRLMMEKKRHSPSLHYKTVRRFHLEKRKKACAVLPHQVIQKEASALS